MLCSESARATLGDCAGSVGTSVASLSTQIARNLPGAGIVNRLREEYKTSPSIFERTPVDAIWHESHRFLRWKRTAPHKRLPFRPKCVPHGSIRVEYYADVERLRQGWLGDAWADIPLTYLGELELGKVTKLWGLEPHKYAILDLPRYQHFYPANQEHLSRLAISVHTKDFTTPLRIVETSVSQVTRFKREIRAWYLTILALVFLFTNLFAVGTATQMDCYVPFSPTFWEFYTVLCNLRHLVFGMVVPIAGCLTDVWRVASRQIERVKSTNFSWLTSEAPKVALILWLLLAEAVSCGFIRVW